MRKMDRLRLQSPKAEGLVLKDVWYGIKGVW